MPPRFRGPYVHGGGPSVTCASEPFNENTATTHWVITVPANLRFKVVHVMLVAEGDVAVTYYSGATALSGPMDLAANVGFVDHPGPDSPLPGKALGDDFGIALSAAVQVSGYVLYYMEPQ